LVLREAFEVRADLQTQQTPKLPAQGPLASPPRLAHSARVRHVPLSPDAAAQGWFANCTTVNSDKTATPTKHFSVLREHRVALMKMFESILHRPSLFGFGVLPGILLLLSWGPP